MTWLLIGLGLWALICLAALTLAMARRSDEDPRIEAERHEDERRAA